MLTSYAILKALENHPNIILEALNNKEKRHLIKLLSDIAYADNRKTIEDAVDVLVDFSGKFPALDDIITQLDNGVVEKNIDRGKPDVKATEKEKQIRLFANRLIKAIEESSVNDVQAKEKINENC